MRPSMIIAWIAALNLLKHQPHSYNYDIFKSGKTVSLSAVTMCGTLVNIVIKHTSEGAMIMADSTSIIKSVLEHAKHINNTLRIAVNK